MLYFAYGSNLNHFQMKRRCKDSIFLKKYELKGFRLNFRSKYRAADIEKKNKSLNNIKIVKTMHQRKMEMFNQADCFIIFPGGIGTLEEFFEVYSWKQLRLHTKPIYIYNLNNFWNELLSLIDRLIDEDFAGENMKEAYKVINNYDDLTKLLENNG